MGWGEVSGLRPSYPGGGQATDGEAGRSDGPKREGEKREKRERGKKEEGEGGWESLGGAKPALENKPNAHGRQAASQLGTRCREARELGTSPKI